ncbi:MAG: acyl-CoA dehydratase activase-related protein [Bacteroidales bacterium]|jgi:predicted CoA-substrate-specific enzyme activase|nr:acyl-CoA dehydratase activase-related protein [Bacteroidales bacterium]
MNKNIPELNVGIDIGSTTFKLVAVDTNGKMVFSDYRRHNTDIKQAARDTYEKMYHFIGDCLMHVVLTGSVGMGYAEKIGARFVQEVVAAAELIKKQYPQVHTFIDMGGEDSKMIFFEQGKIPDIRMNGNCAGGTGAFIDQTAALLEIDTKELNSLAEKAKNIYPIASRCGVFSKTDIQNLSSRNVSKNDIAASVFNAVAIQVVASLSKGTDILPQVFFCGGPFAFLPELKKAFIRVLSLRETDCILPENAELIPAWGCALMSKTDQHPTIRLMEAIYWIRFQKENPFESDLTGRLPALFASEEDFNQWRKNKLVHFVPRTSWGEQGIINCYLGVDSGSTTTKIVLLDEKGQLVFQDYGRNKGDSFNAFLESLNRLKSEAEQHGKIIRIIGSAATGYGENLLQTAFNLDHGIVETIAHFMAAQKVSPEVSFILDIGGQDMKAIYIENGNINQLEINEACSSGCGSFIESFANMLNYSVAEFATMSCHAKNPYDLGTRCTVFMNSKVKQAMREGAPTEDIAAGFSYSVIKNCLFKVLKIKNIDELGNHIVVQGGTFKNLSVVRALELLTQKEVYFSDIPELMGAYGAALFAKQQTPVSDGVGIDQLITSQKYTSNFENCKGCENNCFVKTFHFSNGNTFYSGNNCEKIYSNKSEHFLRGVNQHTKKYALLFNRSNIDKQDAKLRIGIPRALGIYENYPFWHALFNACGFLPVLSKASTNRLYEKGIRSLMADNICFPAKLMHGHIMDLIESKVDRIFYPYVVFEQKEDASSKDSYNCPIVAGYSDVIKSSVETSENYNIPFDAPVISFKDEKLLRKSCRKYLQSLGVPGSLISKAVDKAIAAQSEYMHILKQQSTEIIQKAKENNRMLILLACRPYHIDPLIQHKISDCIAEMGIDIITENIDHVEGNEVYKELHSVSQWAYPNRIFKAAYFVANTQDNIHLVQLTSFGCGPDAFILDEVKEILNRKGKNLTLLKIDDVNNIGSLRLRIRSVVESLKFGSKTIKTLPFRTTSAFTKKEQFRTILAPYFAEGYSELLPPLFKLMGYKLINLPSGDTEAAELGLKYANNEVCYPATIVIGSILKALQSGKYDPDKIAIGMTHTGGQCRASNYIALIKNALVTAGYEKVPVISVSLGSHSGNYQPGFELKWRKALDIAFFGLLYSDCISKLYYPSVAREKEKGTAKKLWQKYISACIPYIESRNRRGLYALLEEAIDDFNAIINPIDNIPAIGVVGEIYVKYNSFSHKHVLDWLSGQGIEVVAPSMYNFFINSFVNQHINSELHIKRTNMPVFITDLFYKIVSVYTKKFDRICSRFRYYRPFADIFHDSKLASEIISLAANFGEGWLIPAELAGFAQHGINNAISLQPFGCIANHVISKGIEKRVKKIYPQMNLLSLDFDGGASDANIFNRLHFMVENCKKELENF